MARRVMGSAAVNGVRIGFGVDCTARRVEAFLLEGGNAALLHPCNLHSQPKLRPFLSSLGQGLLGSRSLTSPA